MPTKKKKPTLKAAVNRGFATTSVAKKILPDAEPEDTAPSADAEASLEDTKTEEKINAAPTPPKVAGRYGFDEEDAEQQLLQSLVEKHADKVDKDVARFWKIIEFDRRLAATLPTLDLDKEIRDEILNLASYYARAKLRAQMRAASNPQKELPQVEEEPDELFPPLPKLNAAAASFTPKSANGSGTSTPKMNPGAAAFTPSSIEAIVPEWEDLPAPPLKEASEPFDKILPRALVTRSLLLKLGFTPRQAALALSRAPSTDLNECVAYLAMRLSDADLDRAWSKGPASTPPSASASGSVTPSREQGGKANGTLPHTNGDLEQSAEGVDPLWLVRDGSIPPKHDAYSFERTIEFVSPPTTEKKELDAEASAQMRKLSLLARQQDRKDEASPASNDTDKPAEKAERVMKPPSEESIILPAYRVRELLRHAHSVSKGVNERVADVESDLDIYVAGPIAAWVATRMAIIDVEKMYGWLKRGLGQNHIMSPLGQGYDAANALRGTQAKLYERVREAENVPRWRRDTAEQVLKEAMKKEEELSKKRKNAPDAWVDIFSEFEAEARAKAEAEMEEQRKTDAEAYDSEGNRKSMMDAAQLLKECNIEDGSGNDDPTPEEADKLAKKTKKGKSKKLPSEQNGTVLQNGESAGHEEDSTKPEQAPEDQDDLAEGGMFGTMLNEQPKEVRDANTNRVVLLRDLPTQAKSGGGGKSPKGVLLETLRRIDPNCKLDYKAVGGGGRICRSRLTMRWCGSEGAAAALTLSATQKKLLSPAETKVYVDTYQLTGEGCESQTQADDLLATLALNCIEKDRPVQRLLATGYRIWWDEIEDHRGADRDAASRQVLGEVRDTILPRLTDPSARIEKIATKESDGQRDFSTLASSGPRPLNEAGQARLKERFEAKTSTDSYKKMLEARKRLPIFDYRSHILEVLENNQIFVLSAETGAGKSTQVPAYILEHNLSRGKPCKIYCTEPRRISAISLAERVSAELGEAKGKVGTDDSLVGYAIRLESVVGRNAALVFATTGIVLRMLEGDAFNEITHLILDEVHERSIESDFLLIIVKTLMTQRPDVKVILMSATIDAERISAYFGGCPTVSVPGRTFPVQVQHLEDAIELCDYILESGSPYEKRLKRKWGQSEDLQGNVARLKSVEAEDNLDDSDAEEAGPGADALRKSTQVAYSPRTIETIDRLDDRVVNHELIGRLLETICLEKQEFASYSRAVLIFMPGLAEIRACYEMLSAHNRFGSTNEFKLYPLHSTISTEEQSAAFEIPPDGVRKIVIATNIAETGITIPDITCVIDTGRHREMRYDEKRHISRLVDCFIAKSNAKQRRGRAGRVQEGLCFHLFTKLRYEDYLDDHPLPEMLRLSLQDLALKLKVMKIKIGTDIENALSQALDPPSAINIQRAIASLVDVKALTTLEEITPLGRHLSRLPLDVQMGKFLLIATVFRCLDPALTIAAALNSKSPFLTPFGKETQARNAKHGFKVADSDFMTVANAFNSWRRASANNHARTFCQKNFLSQQTLQQIEELRQQYLTYLIDAGFVSVTPEMRHEIARARYKTWSRPRFTPTPKEYNIYSSSVSVVNAAAAAGLYPKLIAVDPNNFSLRTIGNNQPVFVHPSSVNFKSKLSELPKGVHHFLYFNIMQSRRLYAWETAALDDRAIILACGEADAKLSANSLFIDRKLKFGVPDLKTNVALEMLRDQMNRLITGTFKTPSKVWSEGNVAFFDVATRMLGAGTGRDALLQG